MSTIAIYSYLIKLFLDSLSEPHQSSHSLVLLSSILLLCLASTFLKSLSLQRAELFGLILRKTLKSALYWKLLKLPVSGVKKATAGKLINLASGDMALIEQRAWSVPSIVGAPLSSSFYFLILFHIVRRI